MPVISLLPALLFLVAASLSTLPWAGADPGLLNRIQTDPEKFKMVITGMALDSLYVSSTDMGVRRLNFTYAMPNSIYPQASTTSCPRVPKASGQWACLPTPVPGLPAWRCSAAPHVHTVIPQSPLQAAARPARCLFLRVLTNCLAQTVPLTSAVPQSPRELRVLLTVFLKYMTHGEGSVTIKGIVSAETRDVAKTPSDLYAAPVFTLATVAGAPVHTFTARAVIHSYWYAQVWAGALRAGGEPLTPPSLGCDIQSSTATVECGSAALRPCHSFRTWSLPRSSCRDPPAQSAMVYGFETTFSLGDGWSASPHRWLLSTDLAPTQTRAWSPASDLNLMDGRGIYVPQLQPGGGGNTEGSNSSSGAAGVAAKETFVVLKPLYNFSPSVFGPLIFRHVEYYQVGIVCL